MRYVYLFVAFCFVLSACQSAPQDTEAAGDTAEAEAPATSDRPDPQNPANDNDAVPSDWMVRLDNPDAAVDISRDSETDGIYFVNMVPGWHITTGPAAIFYHDGSTAQGNYTAEADIHLFNPGERREAFGMLFGGSNLGADDQAYEYFLIRNSGEYLIKRRRGAETETIQDWTASEHIVRYTDEAESSVLNKLAVQVEGESVIFMINGETVNRYDKSMLETDGMVGLRVNHALNLHVSNLNVTEAG